MTEQMPDWVVSFDICPTPAEDYDCDICRLCGTFYWKVEGHVCHGPGTFGTNATNYVNVSTLEDLTRELNKDWRFRFHYFVQGFYYVPLGWWLKLHGTVKKLFLSN